MTGSPRRVWPFVALALLLVPLFIRLGVWQLDRLRERRANNANVRAQLEAPEIPFGQLETVSDSLWRSRVGARAARPVNRRVLLEGTPDYEHEIIVTGRSRNGSPGVYIVTPVRPPGESAAVLVNRGWVYSPDASSVDLSRWREERTAFRGYTQAMPWGHTVQQVEAMKPKGQRVRILGPAFIDKLIPYKTDYLYVVSQDSQTDKTPARLGPPSLDDGPHLSYAIQWFSFATIALVGAGAVVVRARRDQRQEQGTESA